MFVYPAVEICGSLRQFIQLWKLQQALRTAMSVKQTNSKRSRCRKYLVHTLKQINCQIKRSHLSEAVTHIISSYVNCPCFVLCNKNDDNDECTLTKLSSLKVHSTLYIIYRQKIAGIKNCKLASTLP